jgi:formate hydrogenlyase subunit 6/NADH:ubiquinone oxidoreductase subunit I
LKGFAANINTMFDYSDDSKRIAEEVRTRMGDKPARKIKTPKLLAVIDQSGCTGCEACIQFCPVDCIELVPGDKFPDMGKMVEVDLDRCIGCKLCAKHCPWDTIPMVPSAEAEDLANQWTLRSVIAKDDENQIWPRPEPIDESTEESTAVSTAVSTEKSTPESSSDGAPQA